MAIFKRKDGVNYYYKFVFKGRLVCRSTGQGDKRVAEQIEANHRTALAVEDAAISGCLLTEAEQMRLSTLAETTLR